MITIIIAVNGTRHVSSSLFSAAHFAQRPVLRLRDGANPLRAADRGY